MASLFRAAVKEGASVGGENATKLAVAVQHWAGGSAIAAASGLIVSQLEYNDVKDELAELYKKELATQLGKSEKDIKAEDLETLAKGNRTIREDLRRAKQNRNLNIGVIGAATLGSVAIAVALLSGAGLVGFTGWLVTTLVATAAYMLVKSPLQHLGRKIFGIDKKTTGERIAEIQKQHADGKVVTREQVFDVFVQAQPQLAQAIEQQFGMPYEKLNAAEKLQIVEQIGGQLGIAQITDDINQGRVRATELAFTVDGQQSGVAPTAGDVPKRKGIVGKIKDTVEKAVGYHPADDKPAGFSFADRERDRRALSLQTQR